MPCCIKFSLDCVIRFFLLLYDLIRNLIQSSDQGNIESIPLV